MPDRTPQKKIKKAETQESFAEPESVEIVEKQASATTHTARDIDVLPAETEIDGKYQIKSCLGKGGTGVVYKVLHVGKNKEFALKLLSGEFSESQLQRFQSHAKAASLLDHPNLAKVADFGIQGNKHPYFVMEIVEGITLADYLKRCARLTYDDIFAVFLPLCWALQDAHEKGVIHRNVKPSNIMLIGEQGNWQCKLLDLGLGKLAERNRKSLETDPSIENFLYMSPEQCSGKKLDNHSDIYSLGCNLFEAITARPPFRGTTVEAIINQHLSEKPPTLKEASLGRDFPVELEAIVQTMLSKDPLQRFSSCSQVAENLMRLKLSQQLRIKTKAPTKAKEISQERLIIVLGVATAFATGLAFFFWLQLNKPAQDAGRRLAERNLAEITSPELRTLPNTARVTSDAGTAARVSGTGTARVVSEVGTARVSRTGTARVISEVGTARVVSQSGTEGVLSDGHLIDYAQPLKNRSTTPFLYKVENVRGKEFRRYQFPDQSIGIFEDKHATGYQAVGIQSIVWNGPMKFYPTGDALNRFPRLFKRFKDDEIRAITLKHNHLSADALTDLSTYKNLNELNFDHTDLDNAGLKYIERIPTLTVLSLLSTNVSPRAVADFARLQSLKKLSLGEMLDAIMVLNAVRKSHALEELQLINCPNMTPNDYQLIAALPNLKKFTFQDISGLDRRLFDALAKSKSLKELNIENLDISDAIIQSLGKLKHLQVLVLPEKNMSLEQKGTLKKLLPQCDIRFQIEQYR